jgi:hypothetical protein
MTKSGRELMEIFDAFDLTGNASCRADEIGTATTPEFGVYSKALAAERTGATSARDPKFDVQSLG